MNALRGKQVLKIFNIPFHYLIDVGQVRHRLSCFVYDEARTSLVRKVLDAFCRYNLHELDMSIVLGNPRQMHIYQTAELVAILVEVEDHKGLRVCFCYFSNVFVPRDLVNLSVFLFCGLLFDFFHTVSHVLFSEFVFEI